MTCPRVLRCLLGILVTASLLMAPLGGHADQADPETTGVLAALSATCLDFDDGNDSSFDHDTAACHACPSGCFGSCALACSSASVDLSLWKTSDHGTDWSERYLAFAMNAVKARSPPAA